METTNKDPWKDWVKENEESLNQRQPKDLWAKIEQELDPIEEKPVKTISLKLFYRIAALFVLSLGVGYFLMYNHFNNSSGSLANQKPEEKQEELNYPKEFLEAENYYAAEIDEHLTEVRDLIDDESLIEEITLLQEEFEELREEMGDHINDERIVEAMIQNYRLRLDLLKEILGQLKNSGPSPKDRRHEAEAI